MMNEIAGDFESARLVVLWLGANDAVLEHVPQHVPLEEYDNNLRRMITLIRQSANGADRYHSHTHTHTHAHTTAAGGAGAADIKAVTEIEAKIDLSEKGVTILLLTPPPVDIVKWDAHCVKSGRVRY
jgi:lysophospholipase L1-like esterase